MFYHSSLGSQWHLFTAIILWLRVTLRTATPSQWRHAKYSSCDQHRSIGNTFYGYPFHNVHFMNDPLFFRFKIVWSKFCEATFSWLLLASTSKKQQNDLQCHHYQCFFVLCEALLCEALSLVLWYYAHHQVHRTVLLPWSSCKCCVICWYAFKAIVSTY